MPIVERASLRRSEREPCACHVAPRAVACHRMSSYRVRSSPEARAAEACRVTHAVTSSQIQWSIESHARGVGRVSRATRLSVGEGDVGQRVEHQADRDHQHERLDHSEPIVERSAVSNREAHIERHTDA
jgi:hypothetical protein